MLKFSTQKHLGLLAQRFSAAEMTCCTKFNGSSQRRRPKRPRALYAGPNFLMSWWTGPLGTRPCLFQEIAQQKSELGVMIKVIDLLVTTWHVQTGCNKIMFHWPQKGSIGPILHCAEVLFCNDPCPDWPGIKHLLAQDSNISLLEFQAPTWLLRGPGCLNVSELCLSLAHPHTHSCSNYIGL